MGTVNSTLWTAVQDDEPVNVMKSIKAGADPNGTTQFVRERSTYYAKSKVGLVYEIEEWCPIHFASDRGYSQVVYVLLQNKAMINQRVETRWARKVGTQVTYEQTALHLACKNGHKQVIEVLLSLHTLMNMEHSIDMLDFSMHRDYDHKIDGSSCLYERKSRTVLGYTPLHYAIMNGDKDIIELLLFHGARTDTVGCTPIYNPRRGWHPNKSTFCTALSLALKLKKANIATLVCQGTDVTTSNLLSLCAMSEFSTAQYLVKNNSNYAFHLQKQLLGNSRENNNNNNILNVSRLGIDSDSNSIPNPVAAAAGSKDSSSSDGGSSGLDLKVNNDGNNNSYSILDHCSSLYIIETMCAAPEKNTDFLSFAGNVFKNSGRSDLLGILFHAVCTGNSSIVEFLLHRICMRERESNSSSSSCSVGDSISISDQSRRYITVPLYTLLHPNNYLIVPHPLSVAVSRRKRSVSNASTNSNRMGKAQKESTNSLLNLRKLNKSTSKIVVKNVHPIHGAAFFNRIKIAELFLNYGNSSSSSNDGGNETHESSRLDPDYASDYGLTALHIACMYGYKKLASVLISHGANPYLKTCIEFERQNSYVSVDGSQINVEESNSGDMPEMDRSYNYLDDMSNVSSWSMDEGSIDRTRSLRKPSLDAQLSFNHVHSLIHKMVGTVSSQIKDEVRKVNDNIEETLGTGVGANLFNVSRAPSADPDQPMRWQRDAFELARDFGHVDLLVILNNTTYSRTGFNANIKDE